MVIAIKKKDYQTVIAKKGNYAYKITQQFTLWSTEEGTQKIMHNGYCYVFTKGKHIVTCGHGRNGGYEFDKIDAEVELVRIISFYE